MLKLKHVQARYGELSRELFLKKVQCEWLVTNVVVTDANDTAETTVFNVKDLQKIQELSQEPNFQTSQENLAIYPIIKRIPNPSSSVITLGRAKSNDIVIPDGSISKVHAYFGIQPDKGGRILCDMDSTNGTYLREERIIPNVTYPLKTGDRLIFGQLAYTYYTARSFYDVFLSY